MTTLIGSSHASHFPALPARAALKPTPLDVVSDVLQAVRLRGAVYFSVSASAPWAAEAPPSSDLARYITQGAEHVIEYHALVSGTCWASLLDGTTVELGPGDIVLFPHGDAHVMSSGPGMSGPRDLPHRKRVEHERLPIRVDLTRAEADSGSQLVCGFLAYDAMPFNPVISALPRLLHIKREERAGAMLDLLIGAALAESTSPRPGGDAVLARMSELMFVEVMRSYLGRLEPTQIGWLSGLRDPMIGRAIAALHARPAYDWTLDELAREVAASRSSLAERFTQLVGAPPIQYLTQWRMQLAARLLAEGATLAQIAEQVGYGSEAAFSRAFKKIVGVAPASWRAARADHRA